MKKLLLVTLLLTGCAERTYVQNDKYFEEYTCAAYFSYVLIEAEKNGNDRVAKNAMFAAETVLKGPVNDRHVPSRLLERRIEFYKGLVFEDLNTREGIENTYNYKCNELFYDIIEK